jgi:murein DD-endopeptidase MepM/ murein hydrolase activator NlpD
MARFGDKRSYVLQGKVVDQQTHLGEDLANLLHTPVPAANRGLVVLAEPLGIYGQTVMLDHGLGVCSMYSHLGKIEVKAGDKVEKGKVVGLSGATGLAGGDHLHYAVLVQGEFVDPVEWWDAHWLKDQVEGLWGKTGVAAAAAGTGAVVAAPTAEAPVKKKGKGKKSRGKERRY